MFRTELINNIRYLCDPVEESVDLYFKEVKKTLLAELEIFKGFIKDWANAHQIELGENDEDLEDLAISLLSQAYDYQDYAKDEDHELNIPFNADSVIFLKLIETCNAYIKENWRSYNA
ncbi:MAG: hypothetical protein HEQ32_01905 [Vampirovibrio sp.]